MAIIECRLFIIEPYIVFRSHSHTCGFDIQYSIYLLSQENILLDAMFEVPGSDISDVIIMEETVKEKKPAEYVRKPRNVESEDYESDSGLEEEKMSLEQ